MIKGTAAANWVGEKFHRNGGLMIDSVKGIHSFDYHTVPSESPLMDETCA
jgi:hypothetical protein